MPRHLKLLGTVMCLFMMVGFCQAQSTNATITGSITDQSGGILPGATVEITNAGTGVVNIAKTNDAGIYRVGGLVPGDYRARIVKEGFKAVVKEGITLHVQDQVSINFILEVGSVTENVTVEAGQPLLQTESTDLSQVVEGRTVAETPLNGRNVLNLVTLVPGVVAQGGTAGNPTSNSPNGWGNYQIGGGMANQSSSYLDGAPINVSYVNLTALMPSQDSIQEFRVATNNVSPQYGRFAGGVVNFSTKSGTNEFHGSAFEYIRNNVLNANNFFNNRTGLPRPEFTQNQFGTTVGGPIKRDKIFGFFSWEGYQ
ncbi:MAG: carboxypeptidase regulatory-like domain-containing protein, partial [Formivibrio sp.]|nr:carboxypeptidase regulatory-like domain-containing protein [Formivibrio sp.]